MSFFQWFFRSDLNDSEFYFLVKLLLVVATLVGFLALVLLVALKVGTWFFAVPLALGWYCFYIAYLGDSKK